MQGLFKTRRKGLGGRGEFFHFAPECFPSSSWFPNGPRSKALEQRNSIHAGWTRRFVTKVLVSAGKMSASGQTLPRNDIFLDAGDGTPQDPGEQKGDEL